MKDKTTFAILVLSALAPSLHAQDIPRRAVLTGGNFDSGKCTLEVVVDGAAEVEVRGDNATLRNLKGQMPQWRRFVCTSPMPVNPPNFRFAGVDGRGRQQLVRDPRQGGVAVVRIEDPDNGSEGYTFDLEWGGGAGPGPGRPPDNRGDGRGPNRRWTVEEAVRGCQDAVQDQAAARFGRNFEFLKTTIDDQPGRNDWVVGTMAVRRGPDRRELYRFSCSVNFDTGRVRSADIDRAEFREGGGNDRRESGDRAVANCRRSVEERLRSQGYDRWEFRSINVDDRPGRNDWVVGTVNLQGRGRSEFRDFSCSVDLRDGDVRSVDVRSPR
jgi:hypothetical protein